MMRNDVRAVCTVGSPSGGCGGEANHIHDSPHPTLKGIHQCCYNSLKKVFSLALILKWVSFE